MKTQLIHKIPIVLILICFVYGSATPANDNWKNPTLLSGENIEISGNNSGATSVGPEYNGDHGVWYKWSPATSGAFEISTDGSSIDTYLTIYRQSSGSFSELQDLKKNDNRDASTTDSALRIKLNASVDYRILVSSANTGETGAFKLQIKRLPPPPNDTAAGATVLSGDFPIIIDDNTPATEQPGENGDGLWYRWTATRSATYLITTAGSKFFSNLTVYSGASANSLTKLAYTDDAEGGSSYAASTELPLTAGTQYWFLVVNPIPSDAGRLQLSLGIPPSNDLRESAIDLPQSMPVATGDNRAARAGSGESGYHGIWYKWSPPQNGGFSFSTEGSEIDTALVVHAGPAPDDLVRLGSNDDDPDKDTVTSRLDLNLLAAETYWIVVSSSNEGDVGEVKIRIDPIPAPPNDTPEMALLLSGTQIAEISTINGASTNNGERGSYGVWYRWTASQSGSFLFSTARSAFDTVLTVYSGTSASNLSELAFNDESPENPQKNYFGVSSLVLDVQAGTTYWILVSGADDSQSGIFALGINAVPANDTPDSATLLTGLEPVIQGDNTGAIGSTSERGVQSVWYRWTAPMSREYKIQAVSSDFDTILTIFEGPNAGNRVEVGFNDNDRDLGLNNWSSGFTIVGEAGTTYWFQVSAKFEGQTGRFTVAVLPGVYPQTFEEWVQTELMDHGVKTGIGRNDDYDQDGLVHLVEYAFGLNPRGYDKPDFVRMYVTLFGEEERLVLFYERRKAATAPGLSYTTEFSGDQINWSSEGNYEFVESLNSVWEEVRVEPDDTPNGKFKTGRVLVSQQP